MLISSFYYGYGAIQFPVSAYYLIEAGPEKPIQGKSKFVFMFGNKLKIKKYTKRNGKK